MNRRLVLVAVCFGAMCFGLAACTPLGLNTASANLTSQEAASPGVLGAFEGDPAVATARDWTSGARPS